MNRLSFFSNKRWRLALFVLALLAAGWWFLSTTWLYRPLLASFKSRAAFTRCTADPRILCEPGAQALANALAPHLDHAIATVQRAQFGAFTRPVVIYAYARHDSFAAFTGLSQPRAAVFNGAVHVSPITLRLPDGPAPTLVHELSHLQLNLALGNWGFGAIPPWFTEGLATHVAGGAGAEMAGHAGAVHLMAERKCFTPVPDGSRFFPKRRIPQVRSIDMFYRQSAMFIAYLEQRDLAAFERTLRAVGGGQPLGDAVAAAYGRPLTALWGGFLDKTRADFNRVAATPVAALCAAAAPVQ